MNAKHIYIILSSSAPSICSYEKPDNLSLETISLDLLYKIVALANKYSCVVSFIHGDDISDEFYNAILKCDYQAHIMDLKTFYAFSKLPNITVSISPYDYRDIDKKMLSNDLNRSAIVRFNAKNVDYLAITVKKLLRVTRRISIVCEDYSYFKTSVRQKYKYELEKIGYIFKQELSRGKLTEINVLSDLIILNKENKCDAGVADITFAYDGKMYPCPAFFYNKGDEFTISYSLDNDTLTYNSQGFDLRPVCQNCNMLHCKRCAFINRSYTGEACIPPYELCEIAILESQIAQDLMDKNG